MVPLMLELANGQVLAGYRVEGLVGRGGMGVVYRATQLALDRPVALKLITPDLAGDPAFRERFQRESRIAAQLEHAHVIPVHEAGEADGLLYIAMRLIDGIDLRELIRRYGQIEPVRAVRILGQVGSALDAAHARGLVHRDIKPGNVLIANEGGHDHAYLTDFGLTKQLGSESGVTQTGMFVGTVDYIAPEQIQGLPLDARSDVYSLGCLLYHTLSGRVPFERDTDVAKIFAHMSEPPPPLGLASAAYPPALEAVLGRSMAKDPADRYPSAGDLARAASAAIEGSAVSLPERSVATGAAAPATRLRQQAGGPGGAGGTSRTWKIAAAALGALALVLLVALLASGGDSGGGDVREGSAFEDDATLITPVEVKTPAGSTVGDEALWVSNYEQDTITRVDLESGETGDPIAVGDGPAGLVTENGFLWVVNNNAGTISRIEIDRDTVVGNPIGLQSTTDGDSIAAGDSKVWVATPGDGRVVPIDPSSGRPGPPIELPDGTIGEIAFGAGALWVLGDHGTVTRVDPGSGKAGKPLEVGSKLSEGAFRGEIAASDDAVWVAGLDDEAVIRIDPGSGKVAATIRIPDGIEGDLAADNDQVWAVDEASQLLPIDPEKNALGGRPISAGTAGANEITMGGGAIWVSGVLELNTLNRVDPP